ncbi:hypothetical protein Tco_1442025 [Tanacetum coccineum]
MFGPLLMRCPVLTYVLPDIGLNLDHLDAQERKQHTSTFENTLDFEDEILDAEVQENEATPLSDEEIALDAASQGTMASGSGGEEQDFDYNLLNYGIDD